VTRELGFRTFGLEGFNLFIDIRRHIVCSVSGWICFALGSTRSTAADEMSMSLLENTRRRDFVSLVRVRCHVLIVRWAGNAGTVLVFILLVQIGKDYCLRTVSHSSLSAKPLPLKLDSAY
jgi:hypothetical protein